MPGDRIFEVDRADPFATRFDDVLGAIGNLHKAIGIDRGNVARREPAIAQGRALPLEIPGGNPWAPHHQFAHSPSVVRQVIAVGIDNAHLDTKHRPALFRPLCQLFVGRQACVLRQQAALGTKRARFGHAPGMAHFHAKALHERPDQRGRHGGATDHTASHGRRPAVVLFHMLRQAKPDGRNARAARDALCLHQLEQACAIQPRPRQYQLASVDGCRIRDTPGIDVEHRHHRQHAVMRRERKRIGKAQRKTVENGGPVRVKHALRVARRARRIAKRAGCALVELRPHECVAALRQEGFIASQPGQCARRWHGLAIAHQHVVPESWAVRRDGLHQRKKRGVKQQHLILGMVEDVRKLFRVQAWIAGMQDCTAARDSEIGLDVAMVVPCERTHCAAVRDAKLRQHVCQPAAPRRGVAIRIAMQRAICFTRYDFRIRKLALRVLQHRRHQQRAVHHQSIHAWFSSVTNVTATLTAPAIERP
ncbi:hypothetical protein D3C81_932710 [compost metagenome]